MAQPPSAITVTRRLGFAGAALALLCVALPSASLAQAPQPAAAAATAPKVRTLGGGAWSWFGDPRGVHHQNRTYVGWVDERGTVKVASFDQATKLRTTAVIKRKLHHNDHANPSLHVLPDGRLMVFYNRHDGARMFYRVTLRPGDVRAWRDEHHVPTNTAGRAGKGYAYPNPVRLGGNQLFLFWRGGNWQPTFSSTTDGGRNWKPAQTLVDGGDQRPYIKYASNGKDEIHFAFTQGNPGSANTNIYYARYKRGSNSLQRADGTTIKSFSKLPLLPSEADSVYDTDKKTWIHDIALDPKGRPVVVFAVFNSESDHQYFYARWTGTAWRYNRITSAGPTIGNQSDKDFYYSGGITLDHENTGVVYLSRKVRQTFEVETWRTGNGGDSFKRQPVTSRSTVKNVRPISPRGLRSFGDDMSIVWLRGNYSTYLNYQTDITTRLLNGGNIPPIAETTEPAPTGRPRTFKFSGARSSDPDGSRLDYVWRFGDGKSARGKYVTHTYPRAGRYFANLVVTDEDGDKDVFVNEVTVKPAPSG